MTTDTPTIASRRPAASPRRALWQRVLRAGLMLALGLLVALPAAASAQTPSDPSAACLAQQDYGFTTHGACVAFLASGNQGAAFIEDQCQDPQFVANLERITGQTGLNHGQCVKVALAFFGH